MTEPNTTYNPKCTSYVYKMEFLNPKVPQDERIHVGTSDDKLSTRVYQRMSIVNPKKNTATSNNAFLLTDHLSEVLFTILERRENYDMRALEEFHAKNVGAD